MLKNSCDGYWLASVTSGEGEVIVENSEGFFFLSQFPLVLILSLNSKGFFFYPVQAFASFMTFYLSRCSNHTVYL